ncbi:hypothetical protein ACA910_001783 [Epithemia clementina (nom. ined.)]
MLVRTAASTTAGGRMPKHVIVGGLGNLGWHLQRVLLDLGKAVTVIDRPTTHPYLQHDSVEYIPFTLGGGGGGGKGSGGNGGGNVTNDDVLQQALQGADTVYSVVTPDVQNSTRSDFMQVNHYGIQQLIQACQAAHVPKLVHASSIAVMNHLIPHSNTNETQPLPAMDSYQTFYDLTKRLGEEAVLGANSTTTAKPTTDSSPPTSILRTCALRFGGIMAGPKDYYFRQHFQSYHQSGTLYTSRVFQPIDVIAAWDCSRAMATASERLEDDDDDDAGSGSFVSTTLAGKAIFCTKDKSQTSPTAEDVAKYLVDRLKYHRPQQKCSLQYIPDTLYHCLRGALWAKYHGWQLFVTPKEDDLPGIPMHTFLKIPMVEQTFDNALALQLLKGWSPELSWHDALDDIVQQEEQGHYNHKTQVA